MGCFSVLKHIQKKYEKSKSKHGGKNENRTSAFSSPLALDATQQQISKLKATSMKEHYLPPCPQPLPLPPFSEQRSRKMKERRGQPVRLPYPPLRTSGSIKSRAGTSVGSIRYFSQDEIIAAIHNYSSTLCVSECLNSTIYMASFVDGSKLLEATVNSLHPSTQDVREFINEVNILASLQHPNLCKLLGFYANESCESRMLVYERLWHGSLDHLLFVRSNGPTIDWNMRIKVAISAAQGLTFLHEEGPLQAMYSDFSAANIHIDKDFTAKLSGYGCVGLIPGEDFLNNSTAAGNLSKETLKKGMLTPKSNVWSFGIVLLELLTGRKNFDSRLPNEERNLIKWCRPFFTTDTGLSQIMDPRLKGQFPPRAARTVAEIAQRCLQKEPSERPTMRTIVENLNMIQQELVRGMSWKQMSRSTSAHGRLSFSPLLPPYVATTSTLPTMLPPPPHHHHHHHASSSNFNTGKLNRQESINSSSVSI